MSRIKTGTATGTDIDQAWRRRPVLYLGLVGASFRWQKVENIALASRRP